MAEALRSAHVYPVRVYYEDTDAGGIVYHASYLRFAERARTEYLRSVGANHRSLMAEEGVAFAVRQCTADFLRPARLDDALEVHTRFTDVRGASLSAEQIVHRAAEVVARLTVRLACIDAKGSPRRLPRSLQDAFAATTGDRKI